MTPNKTKQQVQTEFEAVQQAISELQNQQARLGLLYQVQRHNVTRPDWTWFVTGSAK